MGNNHDEFMTVWTLVRFTNLLKQPVQVSKLEPVTFSPNRGMANAPNQLILPSSLPAIYC